VLMLVYFLVSTTLRMLLRLGELSRHPRRFPGVLGVHYLQSAACGGILSAARTRYLSFV
jgi:hypothetical protein